MNALVTRKVRFGVVPLERSIAKSLAINDLVIESIRHKAPPIFSKPIQSTTRVSKKKTPQKTIFSL